MENLSRETSERKLPLPVGKSDWEYIAAHNYCVDKTLLIRDLLASDAGVALFTRPRRFGKTTAMQMLKCFFEKRGEGEPDVRHLFESRAIAHCERADEWMAKQGKHPVIYLTFKDHKARTWEAAVERLVLDIGGEFRRHAECIEALPFAKEREHFTDICEERGSLALLGASLGLLAKALHLHHKAKPYVLIDEYDSPVNTASANGYYDEMVAFMREFLPGAMKDNNHVEMGVMTGVLRVAKEGILSGLNNLRVYTVFEEEFSEHFGFTGAEVEEMARYYGREDKIAEVKSWYDGYDFGGREMYNPWSVLYYFDAKCKPQPYWLDTSSNDLINELVEKLPFDMVETLESLLKKGMGADNPVVPMATELGPYKSIRERPETLYALLVSTGYLKPMGGIVGGNCEVAIPNREVEQVFKADILSKLRKDSGQSRALRAVEVAFFRRDPNAFKEHVEQFLLESASYFDASAEGFYHGLVLGMLSFMRDFYVISSNRESGYGRFDIMLKPRPEHRDFPAVVIEVKAAKDEADDLDALAAEARRQIDAKGYAASLEAEGITDVMKFGYAFCGKRSAICRVAKRRRTKRAVKRNP
ncbi:MAG: AAA family ATPase [Kiritimatiellae bacterium]|nr:AAA family ATPase [Kiritimatiellia bacterium]